MSPADVRQKEDEREKFLAEYREFRVEYKKINNGDVFMAFLLCKVDFPPLALPIAKGRDMRVGRPGKGPASLTAPHMARPKKQHHEKWTQKNRR